MPLQPSPRPHAISSPVEAVSYSTSFTAPFLMTRSACSTTSPSRHPALIVPVLAPPSRTSIRAPGRRYEEPSTLTTVASAQRSPALFAASNASINARTSFIQSPRSFRLLNARYNCRDRACPCPPFDEFNVDGNETRGQGQALPLQDSSTLHS
jgi:hypothetical protein